MPATPRQVLQAIQAREAGIKRAYLEAIAQLRRDVPIKRVEKLIESGQIDELARVLGIRPAAFAGLLEKVRETYMAGGQFESGTIPTARRPDGGVFRVRFDIRNVRAENWLRSHSADLVTAVIEDQREAIRLAVTNGTVLGNNPRTTALEVSGRVSAQTGRREGGVIGITSGQARAVASARAELSSGNPATMRRYFDRTRRDPRLDGIVQRAIDAQRPVAAADIARIADKYSDRLLLLRGETISRTEAMQAFGAARDETYEQAIEQGVNPEYVTKEWMSAGDGRVRDLHVSMNHQKRPFREPFNSPDGARLKYPGDTSLGAGGRDVINCRCIAQTRIDNLAQALAE